MPSKYQKWKQSDDGRFYVYRLFHCVDETLYVGKGTTQRLYYQKKSYQLSGEVIVRFKREDDAYEHERRLVAELKPVLNLCSGGGGSRATPKRAKVKSKFWKELDAIWAAGGGRQYAARLLLNFDLSGYLNADEIDSIRQVAA